MRLCEFWMELSVMCVFQFKVNGEWWTWIDYDKFHDLVKHYYSTNGASTFTAVVNRFYWFI